MLPALLAFLLFAISPLQAAELNHPAPKFALKDSHQQRQTLADYRGKVVFINFWASWCAPCQMELPELNRLAARYAGKNVHILTVNVDRTQAPAHKLLAQLGLKPSHLEILWDSRSKVVSAYNVEAMPSSFIVYQRGLVRFAHSGFHPGDPETWQKEIDSLLGK